jgi:uncharacterized protein YdeI (YjbR/CyaY-like superfamily)
MRNNPNPKPPALTEAEAAEQLRQEEHIAELTLGAEIIKAGVRDLLRPREDGGNWFGAGYRKTRMCAEQLRIAAEHEHAAYVASEALYNTPKRRRRVRVRR